MSDEDQAELNRMARELVTIKNLVLVAITAIREAEAEVPESIRRFTNYMHNIHSIKYMYEELGHAVPDYLLREMERCDDRYRQILKKMHLDGGAFEKVRREMADDPDNRWDHTKLLYPPKENGL